MKRYIVILVTLVHLSTVSGQTLSLKLGPSISKLSTNATPGASNVIDENSLIGFNAIFCIDYLDHKYYTLGSGIGFIQGGGKEEVASHWSNFKMENISVKLNYITLNTTCKLKIPIKDIIEPFVNLGPRLDYLISNSSISNLYNTNPQINKLLYGLLLGRGISFKINKIDLGLACDYYLNFNKVISGQKHDETMSVRTITVNAIIGFKI